MTVLALFGPLVAFAVAAAAFVKLRATPAGLLLTFAFAASAVQELVFPLVMDAVSIGHMLLLVKALGISNVLLGGLVALGFALLPRALR